MALTDENTGIGATMLVSPTNGVPYYGGGFGGGMFGGGNDWLGLLFLIALCNGGFGFGGLGGYGMGMLGMDGFGLYPWLNNSQNMNDGFRSQALNTSVSGIQNAVTSGFGDVQTALCGGFAGVNATVNGAQNAISQQLYTNQLADLERSFAAQTANYQGFNGVQSGIADLRYTTAKEACDTRTQSAMNTRDIVDAIRGGDQMILDKLCALELDGVKGQLAQAQRENVGLQNAVNMATTRAENLANADNIVNSLYNRLSTCPVGTTPVYGNQPIFTCPNNNSGCGCGSF